MSESARQPVRTRFAPSPSGHLHVGGARTALFCWAFAKARGGQFVLRIEDTDQKRSSDASSLAFLEDLKWLGLNWDEGPELDGIGGGDCGPYFQSKRLDTYEPYFQQLLDSGAAYRAFETTEQLDQARATARAEKRAYRYDRASLALDAATIKQYLQEGRPHVIRFKVPDDCQLTFHDEVLGDVTIASSEVDDFVIRKADGYPTYHFAVVVDDELMRISHVIRAQEHTNNTFKHILIQEALNFDRPAYAHISVVTNPDGSKMSKRDKDKALRAAVREAKLENPPQVQGGAAELIIREEEWAWWMESTDRQLDMEATNALAAFLGIQVPEIDVDDFRRAGYLPDVMVNYLALLGWSPGENIEKFDRDFLVERFSLNRIVKSPAKFDRDKLLAFNLDAIQAMSCEQFTELLKAHCRDYHPEFLASLDDDAFAMLAAANHERSKTLEDPVQTCRFFVLPDEQIVYEQSKPIRKHLSGGQPSGFDHLEALRVVLEAVDPWTTPAIEIAIGEYAEMHADGKLGKVAQPLRIAVSGGTVSPPIFDTLAILGRSSTLNRMDRCLSKREELSTPS